MLHTTLRVADLRRSVDLHSNLIDMELLHTTGRPGQKHSLAFVEDLDG